MSKNKTGGESSGSSGVSEDNKWYRRFIGALRNAGTTLGNAGATLGNAGIKVVTGTSSYLNDNRKIIFDFVRTFYFRVGSAGGIYYLYRLLIEKYFSSGSSLLRSGKPLTAATLSATINNNSDQIVDAVQNSTSKSKSTITIYGKSIPVVGPLLTFVQAHLPMDLVVSFIKMGNTSMAMRGATISVLSYVVYLSVSKAIGRTAKKDSRSQLGVDKSIKELKNQAKSSEDTGFIRKIKELLGMVEKLEDKVEKMESKSKKARATKKRKRSSSSRSRTRSRSKSGSKTGSKTRSKRSRSRSRSGTRKRRRTA